MVHRGLDPLGHWDGGWRQTTRTGSPTVSPSPSPSLNPKKTLTKLLCISRHGVFIFTFLDMILFYIFIFPRHGTFFVLQWDLFSWKKFFFIIFLTKKMYHDTRRHVPCIYDTVVRDTRRPWMSYPLWRGNDCDARGGIEKKVALRKPTCRRATGRPDDGCEGNHFPRGDRWDIVESICLSYMYLGDE